MEHYIVVYLMTFPNQKRYVGVTSDLKRRVHQHKTAAKTGNYSSLVHKAIKKYGEANVNVKIMGRFSDYELALKYEIELIESFDSYSYNGYNLTKGGQGRLGFKHSLETRTKISKAKTGKKPIKVRSGYTLAPELKNRIAETLGSGAVQVFRGTECIGLWTNLTKCSKDLGVYRSNITHCLKGKLRSTGGYTFRYAPPSPQMNII